MDNGSDGGDNTLLDEYIDSVRRDLDENPLVLFDLTSGSNLGSIIVGSIGLSVPAFFSGLSQSGDELNDAIENSDGLEHGILSTVGRAYHGLAVGWSTVPAMGLTGVNIPNLYNMTQAVRSLEAWLGPGYTVRTNRAGDVIAMSADGLRKFCTDIYNSHGCAPHANLEILVNGRWRDAIRNLHRLPFRQ